MPINLVPRQMIIVAATAAILILAASGCAAFRGDRPATAAAAAEPDTRAEETAEKAAEIATQPARDLGMAKPEIPAPLVAAVQNPYDLQSTATCPELQAAIAALNEHLGEDYELVAVGEANKVGKAVAAGGQAVVNSIIPFRGLVRELTGAAEAKRRYDDAVDAGYARRGFLRGIQTMMKCRRGVTTK